jgi:hypothetical protein
MSRHLAKSLAIPCFVVIQSSILLGQAEAEITHKLAGDWIYSDRGGTIQYSLSADGHYRSHSVMTAPEYPHFMIEASGIYSVSGENVTFTPQSATSQGESAKLITVTGRYNTATDQLLLMPEGATAFRTYRRITGPLTTPSRDSTLPGVLIIGLLAGGLITLVASFTILSRYKRAVQKVLERDAPEKRPTSAVDVQAARSGEAYLRSWQETTPPLLLYAQARARRLGAVYSVAGLSAVLVWTGAFLLEAEAYGVKPALAFFVIFAWPTVICWNQVTGWSFKTRRRNDLLYAATFAILIVVLWLGFAKSPGQLLKAFFLANLIPTLLILAFSAPPVRSIGPCMLALFTSCALGTWATPHFFQQYVSALLLLSHLRDRLNISALQVVGLLMVASAIIFFSVGWLLMWLVVRNYRIHRNSDQSIQIDSIWLIWCVIEAIFISTSSPTSTGKGAYLALFGFPVYWIVRKVGFAWLRRRDKASIPGISLLYLRRFALNSKTDRLFRAISLLWRFVGEVRLLGGSDLARTTIQPHALLNFISFLGINAFSSQEKVDEQVKDLPQAADPDTRLRVSDFLCSYGVWQSAVSELIQRSEVVLADFRGFNQQNEGSRYEIEALLSLKPLERVLIVTDTAAARDYLAAAITNFWQNMPSESPNYHVRREAARIILQINQETDPLPVLRVLFSLFESERRLAAALAAK